MVAVPCYNKNMTNTLNGLRAFSSTRTINGATITKTVLAVSQRAAAKLLNDAFAAEAKR